MRNIKKLYKNLTFFDYILLTGFVLGVSFFGYVFFRKADYINVTVKVDKERIIFEPWAIEKGTSEWFRQMFYEGMSEKDSLGRVQAEVADVVAYDTKPGREDVYLKLKLLSVYAKSTGQHSYNGKPVLVGSTIQLKLDHLQVEGLVTNIEGVKDTRESKRIRVEAELKEDNSVYLETSGVDPYIADAIKVGEQIKDSQGDVIMTILDKQVGDAERLIITDTGRTFVGRNPLRKKVFLVINANVYKIDNRYFLFDDVPVIVGETIPVNTDEVSIFPFVTKIEEINEE